MFNQGFFQNELPGLLAAFRRERGDDRAQPELLLRHGVFIRVEGEIDARPDYITFAYRLRNERRQAVVPYDSIVAIAFVPDEQQKPKPGLI